MVAPEIYSRAAPGCFLQARQCRPVFRGARGQRQEVGHHTSLWILLREDAVVKVVLPVIQVAGVAVQR